VAQAQVDRVIYHDKPLSFVHDQVSNGHVTSLLARLKATNIKESQLKNADFI